MTNPKRTTGALSIFAAACLALLVLPALGSPATAASTGRTMSAMTTPTSAAFGDREILGVLQTVNAGEVKDSESAHARATSKDVKAFAEEMIRDHKKGEEGVHAAVKAVGTTRTSSLSKQLASDDRTSEAQLAREKGMSYDKAYIADEVKMHQMVLDTIDRELMPKATSAQVKDLLTSTRAAVAEHLSKAQALQTKLGA